MLFWVNPHSNEKISYDQFMVDLNRCVLKNHQIDDSDFYLGMVRMFKSLVVYQRASIVDPHLKAELSNNQIANARSDFNYEALVDYLNANAEKLTITLHTSGTTGRPKEVNQNFKNLTKNVKKKYSNQIWGLVYHPYHMAGLQVILQAFLTKSMVVYIPKESYVRIGDILAENNVSNFASTPTFLRVVLSNINSPYSQLMTYSLGGEKVNETDFELAKKIFPKAKITSIYASTEAGSLFKTNSNGNFEIPAALKEYIKVDEENHLLLHKSILGELVNDSSDWYNTKDVISYVNSTEFKIIGRKSDFVNVGGYKVNIQHIENVILQSAYVRNVKVASRENKLTGSIIVAELILQGQVEQSVARDSLNQLFTDKLAEWERPRILKFVNEIGISETGKVKRL